jgi:hypothetical protein
MASVGTPYEDLSSSWDSCLAVTVTSNEALLKDAYKVLQLTRSQLSETYAMVCKKVDKDKQWITKFDKDNRPRVSTQVGPYKQLKLPASHVVLVKHGFLPTSLGMHASHYCHKSSCMLHLTWEPAYCNETLRKKCFLARACTCGLVPHCRFDLH